MSYTAELKGNLVKDQFDIAPQAETSKEQSENPSTIELFSYGFCCVAQGLITISYLALVVFVPIAISHQLF